MKRDTAWFFVIVCIHLLPFFSAFSQTIPQRLEPMVESAVAATLMPAPDEDLQEDLSRFIKQPMLLNQASKEELQQLSLLSDALIDLLLLHRSVAGPLLHLNELQTIAGFTPALIRQLAPYVRVVPTDGLRIGQLVSVGNLSHDFLLRVTGLFTGLSAAGEERWVGSRQRLLMWHRVQTKSLQAGWLLEKDPGEVFLKKKNPLVDHSGFHLFWRGHGLIRTIALGDFNVNLGQGLLQWQSMAFGKSSEISWIKRQGPVLRPHRGSGEDNFHRGIAATLHCKPLLISFFISRRRLSGRLLLDSSGQGVGITSIHIGGNHRSEAERQRRKTWRQQTMGVSVSFKAKSLHISLNAVRYNFSLPLLTGREPRNHFDIRGKDWYNASLDFSYTKKNLHCFGEGAFAASGASAWVLGAIVTASQQVDFVTLIRGISVAYRALYANAFTESSMVENEQGAYAGITLRPHPQVRIDAYADHFVFPWLRYRSNAPTAGADYLVQLDYRPNKRVVLLIRYRNENKWEATDNNYDSSQVATFDASDRQGWRADLSWQYNPRLSVRTRVEWLQVKPHSKALLPFGSGNKEDGFLFFLHLLFSRLTKGTDLLLRYQYFDTNSYESRIYALSPDLRPGLGFGAFYDRAHQFWLGIDKSLKNNILISLQGQTRVKGGKIESREIKLQLRLRL